ncbi:MAG: DMT family transporter [Deltaproteobacteria bacterium]|nr:DMT family transporter [Deltaproteobacteria bacterium]
MNKEKTLSNILLLITASIWGFGFVAQRYGMDYIGPFYFTGIRFLLGAVILIPVLTLNLKKNNNYKSLDYKFLFKGGLCAGLIMFSGMALQQAGLVYTTASNGGFITGLYIVIVPIISLFLKQKPKIFVWIGILIAAPGLYLLSINKGFTMQRGDFLIFLSIFFWAAHIHVISYFSARTMPIFLAFLQFLFCAFAGTVCGLLFENISLKIISDAIIPIFYAGVIGVGVGFTLQVQAQKKADPNHAALILSMEAVFAAAGGIILLNETMPAKKIFGCIFILAGIIVSQLDFNKKNI